MKSWVRETSVAGSFYPADKDELLEVLGGLLPDYPEPYAAYGAVAPHAGYVYSGRIAGEVYARIQVPDTVVLLCPNHTGLGKRVALWSEGEWQTPLGAVPVDTNFSKALLESGEFSANRDAHFAEHAIETHLPLLLARNPRVRIVPIVLGRLDWEACRSLAAVLGAATRQHPALIVASTDMSHFVSATEAEGKDALALEAMRSLDGEELYRVVRQEAISMCGFIPTAVAMEAVRQLGAKVGEVVAYGHSGEVLKDHSRVVAYAGATLR